MQHANDWLAAVVGQHWVPGNNAATSLPPSPQILPPWPMTPITASCITYHTPPPPLIPPPMLLPLPVVQAVSLPCALASPPPLPSSPLPSPQPLPTSADITSAAITSTAITSTAIISATDITSPSEQPPPLPHRPSKIMRTRRWQRDEADYLRCSCGRGVSYAAAKAAVKEDRALFALGPPLVPISRLEAVPELARSYVERGWVKTRCSQKTLDAHYEKLRGAWRAPPGVVRRDLIEAANNVDEGEKTDMQHESEGGRRQSMVPLADLKRARDAATGKAQDRKGYRRPARRHRGMAHQCEHHHALLDFYGKNWIKGNKAAEMQAHCLEMRHLTLAHHALLEHLIQVFWPVLNAASRNAVYNSCVVMDSVDDEFVNWHSDTFSASEDQNRVMPYVEGAAVIVVMMGMRQMLHTRALNGTGGQKGYDFEHIGVPAIDLEDGSAYVLPAGEPGSVDYLVEHMTYRHPMHGCGKEWEGFDSSRRRVWVFRAIKPEHARWYSQEWPHRMCPPSHAAKLYGERVGAGVPENMWG